MRKITTSICLIGALAVSACDVQTAVAPTTGPKQTNGALIGAVAGGLLGNQVGDGSGQVLATGAGMLLGAMIGSSVGQQLDEVDRMKMQVASQQALETSKTNTPVSWVNPDTGNSGSITPTRTYSKGGSYCREFQQTVVIGGAKESAYGKACRQPDGSWQIIS